VPAPLTEFKIVAFRKKQNHNSRHYKGKNPNSKSNRFKSKLVAKENLAKIRRKVYDEAKEQGMTDMQALVKSFEISPRD
jgi:hypothetical protein